MLIISGISAKYWGTVKNLILKGIERLIGKGVLGLCVIYDQRRDNCLPLNPYVKLL